MPGIAAILGRGSENPERELEIMLARLKGRNDGVHRFAAAGAEIRAGWVGPDDGSRDGGTAVSPVSGSVLLFEGEHFPPTAGPRDAGRFETILEMYERSGKDFPRGLNGFFHGLVIDGRSPKATLFNDRFGMRRLYYHEAPGVVYVATEAKAILAVRPELRSFDTRSLGEWLGSGAVLDDRTLFTGIGALPAGSLWTRHPDGSWDRRAYFSSKEWEDQEKLGAGAYYEALSRAFPGILARYLDPRGPTGLSTTGGLDTRLILAHLGDRAERVRCYSFCGPYRENLDVTIGRKAARIAGCPHTTLRIEPDLYARFEELAKRTISATDGNLDLTGVANLYMCEKSLEVSPIRLTGNYGSEVLRGTRTFGMNASIARVLSPDGAKSVAEAAARIPGEPEGHPLTFILFKQVPWYSYNRLQMEESATIMRSPYMDNELLGLVYRAPAMPASGGDISLRLISDGNKRLGALPTDRGLAYPKGLWTPVIRAYCETLFRLEYLANYGMPRRLARLDRKLGPFSLETLFLGRHKYYHLRKWFRDELSGFVRDVALDPKTLSRDYLDGPAARAAIERHLAGDENHTVAINKIVSLEQTRRLILDSGS